MLAMPRKKFENSRHGRLFEDEDKAREYLERMKLKMGFTKFDYELKRNTEYKMWQATIIDKE
jgi:hypothetical protein